MNKKILILALVLIVAGSIGIYFYMNKEGKKIEVSAVKTIDLSAAKTEAEKVELVKQNIVKVVNKVEDGEIIGTGFFDNDGYLITNSHVVDIKGEITITYSDNTTTEAQLVSNDISSDIAILAVEEPKVLALKTTDTLNLKVTDNVYAIGFPLNISGEATTTKGILSARRSAGGVEYLQTDASMDNGSSGGPLINSNGELVGMNSFSADKSDISLSISSESLLSKIKELKDNKKVNYLEEERPKNALSVVLEEIGYKTDDMYGEKKYFRHKDELKEDKIEKEKEKEEKKENNNNGNNNKPQQQEKKLNEDCSLKTLTVDGYNINYNKNTVEYYITLKNDESSLKVNAVANASTTKVSITGNNDLKYGENYIQVTTTSEAGSHQNYQIRVIKPITYLEGLDGILCSLNVQKINGVNSLYVTGCDFIDSERVRFDQSAQYDIAKKVTINVYAGWNGDNVSNCRFLKSYTFEPGYGYAIPTSEIKALLTEEESTGGTYAGADLTLEVRMETKKQGTLVDYKPWGLQ